MDSSQTTPRPIRVLIAALGGQGGGVLASWVIKAAREAGLIAQGSSIPGVAQRTGATTYYIEIFPTPAAKLDGKRPVLAVYPIKGDVDLLVGGELIEAGRMAKSGYVTPGRTVTVASSHRAFTLTERMAMDDGRYPEGIIEPFLESVSKRALIFDAEALALARGSAANAVLLGAIAGAGVLPMPGECYRNAITGQGRAVERNLKGFEAGLAKWKEPDAKPAPGPARAAEAPAPELPAALETKMAPYAEAARPVVRLAVERALDFQGRAYAELLLTRLASVPRQDDAAFISTLAKRLATWMAFDDVIRVADLKTRPERADRVRREVGARVGQKVVVSEFLKPGLEQAIDMMPPMIGRALARFADRAENPNRYHVGLKVPTTKIWGFALLRALAILRPWRPYSYRYACEQERIEGWLARVSRAARADAALGVEMVEMARLIKGYGETHRRGLGSLATLYEGVIDPLLAQVEAGRVPVAEAARRLGAARQAALADPEGARLREFIGAGESARAAAETAA